MPTGVYQHTKEHNKKISKGLKGHCHSEKTKRKIGEKNKGKKPSNEARLKMSKAQIGKVGPKASNWKGGITSVGVRIRTSPRYYQWRQDVFIRDDFTCQKCGQVGGDLEVHHKKSFAKLLNEAKKYLPLYDLFTAAMLYNPLWDIENGTTFCVKCHKKTKRRKLRRRQ